MKSYDAHAIFVLKHDIKSSLYINALSS